MTNDQHAQPVDETSNSPAPRRRRRWGWALVLGLVCAAAAIAAVYVLVPPNYVASSVVYVDASPDVVLNAGALEDEDYETFKRTQMFRALSRIVLDTALDEPIKNKELKRAGYVTVGDLSLIKAQTFPIDWMETKLSAVGRQEEFFQIEMEHSESPVELAEIVNAVTYVYVRDIANEEKLNDKRRITILQELAAEYQRNIEEKRQQIRRLSQRLGLTDEEPMTRLEHAEQELTRELHSKWIEQYLELHTLTFRMKQPKQSSLDGDAIKTDPQTKALIRSMIEQELKIAAQEMAADRMRADIKLLEETLDDNEHPKLVQIREDLAKQELKVAESKALLQPTLEATLRDYQLAVRERHRASQAARAEVLKESIAATEQELERREVRAKSVTIDTHEFDLLQSKVERLQVHWQKIEDQIDAIKIELEAPNRIVLHQLAETPETKDYTTVYTNSAIAGGGAFVLAFALTLLFAPRKVVSLTKN